MTILYLFWWGDFDCSDFFVSKHKICNRERYFCYKMEYLLFVVGGFGNTYTSYIPKYKGVQNTQICIYENFSFNGIHYIFTI